ncbi:MAG TPA: ABC transporter permease [Burkholderiaceae bacterium]|nr:ABC transporter permease [Burkholderiaceae bacterium]
MADRTLAGAVSGYATQTWAVADSELRKLRHDPWELLTRAVQPILWLTLFGQVMAHVRGISTGGVGYLDFLAPGILAQSVLFVAIFYGISVIWERDLGVLHRYMVSPAPRSALVLGKALSSGVRGLSQAIVIYLCALAMHVELSPNVGHAVLAALFVVLSSALFSTFSLVVATIVKTRERFMGIGQVLTMPIFFASNAIYPIELMPRWLQGVALANPLSYAVDGLRAVMLRAGASTFGVVHDLAVLLAATVVMVAIASRMYPRMTQ